MAIYYSLCTELGLPWCTPSPQDLAEADAIRSRALQDALDRQMMRSMQPAQADSYGWVILGTVAIMLFLLAVILVIAVIGSTRHRTEDNNPPLPETIQIGGRTFEVITVNNERVLVPLERQQYYYPPLEVDK